MRLRASSLGQVGACAAPALRRRSGRSSCAGSTTRTDPGTRPACAGASRAASRGSASSMRSPSTRDRAGGDRLQREQRHAERGLARSRFADDAERLAAAQLTASHRRTAWKRPPSRPALARRRNSTRRRCAAASTGASAGDRLHHALRPAGEQLDRVGVAAGTRTPSSVGPCSTSRPRSITPTRCVKRRTRFRSWVMNRSAMPISRCRSSSRARICAWIVTSSAVVGSSAMRSLRLGTPAPSRSSRAGAGRRRAGADRRRRAARARGCRCGAAARSRGARARVRAAGPRAVSSTSPIWLPTVYSGLSAVIGSWKIIAMSPPRMPRICALALREQVLAVEADRALVGRGRRPAAAPTAP